MPPNLARNPKFVPSSVNRQTIYQGARARIPGAFLSSSFLTANPVTENLKFCLRKRVHLSPVPLSQLPLGWRAVSCPLARSASLPAVVLPIGLHTADRKCLFRHQADHTVALLIPEGRLQAWPG